MSVTSPALLYIVEKYPLGVKLSGLKSGELSRMPLNMPIKGADTRHAEKQNKNKGSLEEGQKQPVGVFLLPGIGCPDPFLGCFYTVIHENLLWVRSGSFY